MGPIAPSVNFARRYSVKAAALAALAAAARVGTAPADEWPPFQLVRSDENYAAARDPALRATLPEPYKYIALSADGAAWLSLGGEIRERYDVFDAPRFGIGSKSDAYDLQRLLLHADLHFARYVRVFAQLGQHDVFGKRTAVLPVDASPLNFQNLFLDIAPGRSGHWRIRLGRQELLLNPTQRFVAVREGPNLRLSYDGGRITWQQARWRVDAFSIRPVIVEPGTFENRGDPNTLFSGAYLSRGILQPQGVIEMYWLALDRWNVRYGLVVGAERRRTVGTRLGLLHSPWDFDLDAAWQYGTFGSREVRAWAVGADSGYTFAVQFRPRVGMRFDGASGGSAIGPTAIRTFDPLFPKGIYFDESLLTTYANLLSVRPSLTLTPVPTLTLRLSEAWRWKQSVQDALYLLPFVAIPGTAVTPGRYVGRWTIVDSTWRVNRWITLQAEYVHVAVGEAVRTAAGHDVNFAMLIWQLRF